MSYVVWGVVIIFIGLIISSVVFYPQYKSNIPDEYQTRLAEYQKKLEDYQKELLIALDLDTPEPEPVIKPDLPVIEEPKIRFSISFLPFLSVTYQDLVKGGYVNELPESFDKFVNVNLVSRNRYILLVPCFHKTCKEDSFYLFVKLFVADLDKLLETVGAKQFTVEYTTDEATEQIVGNLDDLTKDSMIKIGPVNGGSYIDISAFYTIEGKEDIYFTDTISLLLPRMDDIYCSTIPYGSGSHMMSSNNRCFAPTDEVMMHRCLTKYDPTTQIIRVWDNSRGRCVPLRKQSSPSFAKQCNVSLNNMALGTYCDGQTVLLPHPIDYKCVYPRAGSVSYDKDKFKQAFDSKITGETVEDYWIGQGKINNWEDVWKNMYECNSELDGTMVDSYPCFEYATDSKKEACTNYQEMKDKSPNCAKWVDGGGVAVCTKCHLGYYGENCDHNLEEARKGNPNCARFRFTDKGFVCETCKLDYYGDNCSHDIKPVKEEHPDCAQWDYIDETGEFKCKRCRLYHYGENCKYDGRPMMREYTNCDEWKWNMEKGELECAECKTNYYGEGDKCTYDVRPVQSEYPGCMDWILKDGKFKCINCHDNYYGTNENCKYSMKSIQEKHPGCNLKFTGYGFTCLDCKEDYYSVKDKCQYHLLPERESNPGCDNWEFTGSGFKCTKCKKGFYSPEDKCNYSTDKTNEDYPNCIGKWSFNGESKKFYCDKCADYFEGDNCEMNLEEKYPRCSKWTRVEDNRFECQGCEPGFDGENCTNNLMKDYPNCDGWVEVDGELRCKEGGCKAGYTGDKCELCDCPHFNKQKACTTVCPNCKFVETQPRGTGPVATMIPHCLNNINYHPTACASFLPYFNCAPK